MPKKRQGKALLIKPGSNTVDAAYSPRRNDSIRPSVNDLIRESRRLQIKTENSSPLPLAAPVPPQIREALNLPAPEAPPPRPGSRSGPARFRRIPGPPPPRSWLIDSQHAPREPKQINERSTRSQKQAVVLPGGVYLDLLSLLHFTLKDLARNWDRHVDYYGEYLADLPVKIRESLMSYLVVYGGNPRANPLRLLFLTDVDANVRAEVTRLDLTDAIGDWTSLKQLEKDLGPLLKHEAQIVQHEVPETWDTGAATSTYMDLAPAPSEVMFKNLQHLSLALRPGNTASWKDLIRLTEKLPTITSLSLANWPVPTYTPRAASTRALVKTETSRPRTVYGGTNFYTAFDNDWREAAGILRSLSRALYCLKWLDLSGCGSWFQALVWSPGNGDTEGEAQRDVGPDWNGWWRGVEHICLAVGWEPDEPEVQDDEGPEIDIQRERRKFMYRKEMEEHDAVARSAEVVAKELRALRKADGGKWINFQF